MPKKKTEEVAEQVAETPILAAAPAAPRRQSSEDLLELNDQERGVTREDSEDAKWGYLLYRRCDRPHQRHGGDGVQRRGRQRSLRDPQQYSLR